MNNWQPDADLKVLRQRAKILASIRAWFREHEALEVETPILGERSITDPQIQSFKLRGWYLQTSPEYFMKRLLAAGSGDIYQIARVFRDGEDGWRHHSEFSLLEWYRVGFDDRVLAEEVVNLIRFLAADTSLKVVTTTYKSLLGSLGLNLFTSKTYDYKKCILDAGIELVGELGGKAWRELVFAELIQRQLPDNQLTVVHDYPADDAALARLNVSDPRIASRFEVFWGTLELANGFHELTDPNEQLMRFNLDNQLRCNEGLPEVEIDENLIAALESGLPDCAGVALGIDRLCMKLLSADHIQRVIAFKS